MMMCCCDVVLCRVGVWCFVMACCGDGVCCAVVCGCGVCCVEVGVVW